MIKNTKKRNRIIETLKYFNKPLTADEIYTAVCIDTKINLSTVYRSLNVLTLNNIVLKDIRQDGITYYELNDHTHKHHLICNNCNEVINIDTCPIDILEENISKQTGFNITEHTLEFRGICKKCNKEK